MRKVSRRAIAVWASSLAFIILISYTGVAQAQVLDSVRDRIKSVRTQNVRKTQPQEEFENRRETVQENIEERRSELRDRAEEVREEIHERRSDARERISEKREEMQEKRTEVREHVTQVHAERLQHRFSVYGDRLASIISRLEARLESLAENGKDVSAQQARLAEAQQLLVEAENTTADTITTFLDVDPESYEDQRTQALRARDLANSAREQYKAVHQMLVEIVQSLKTERAEE